MIGFLAAPVAPPAGGAPLEDLIPATIVGLVAGALVAWTTIAYRRGGVRWLRFGTKLATRVSGLPEYVALPALVVAISLVVAVFGFYWDVSTHIDNGRDPGPFANPAHYLIIFGLAGIALGGWLSVLIGSPKSGGTSVRIGKDWNAPLGGVLVLLCGGIALLGFPLDDVWHRLFGQDVTLWGPTHVQMVGGASLTTLALFVLLREGRMASTKKEPPGVTRILHALSGGALLLGLSTLQGEFDFGVPQFRLLYQPVLIMLAATIGLVAARITGGRGGALGSVLFFIAIRGLLALAIGPGLGRIVPHFPLYLVEALLVEAIAWRLPAGKHLRLGVLSGISIGTVGLGAEWLWSHLWMSIPWPAALLPEAVVRGFVAAVCGGIFGALIGRALGPGDPARSPLPRWIAVSAALGILVSLAYPLPISNGPPVEARVALQEVTGAPDREVIATLQLEPPDAAHDPMWFEVLAWQGLDWRRGASRSIELEQVAPGTYETSAPVPVHGEWKALVRLHKDNWLKALPLYLPEDGAIPAPSVPAQPNFEREFISDHEVVQREATGGSPGLVAGAYAILILIAIAWLTTLGWGLRRLDHALARAS